MNINVNEEIMRMNLTHITSSNEIIINVPYEIISIDKLGYIYKIIK